MQPQSWQKSNSMSMPSSQKLSCRTPGSIPIRTIGSGRKYLTFPVSELNDLGFSLRPYKWIRYAPGIVVGARGELCTERGLSNPVPIDYDSDLSEVSIDLYYHTTNVEKKRMFPIDPKLADPRTVTSSRESTRRDDFRSRVEGRDGSCVATGVPLHYCQAVHLLLHSMGDTV